MTHVATLRAAADRLRKRDEGLRAGTWPVYMEPFVRERLADEADATADLLDIIAADAEENPTLPLDMLAPAMRLAELIVGGAQ
jgi:hypothetical protein